MAVSSLIAPQTLPLFEGDADLPLLGAYRTAFDGWQASLTQAGTLRSRDSTAVYRHMWEALAAWAVARSIPVASLTAADLDAYLASRGDTDDLSPRYALRLVQLVHRVLEHQRLAQLTSSALTEPNGTSPAQDLLLKRPDIRFAGAADREPLPDYLSGRDARKLVAYLSDLRDVGPSATRAWQDIRNQTSIALMLGGGLTPGEVRSLTLTDVIATGGRAEGVPWKVRVPRLGRTPEREAPIAVWAGRLVRHWLTVRQQQAIPGPVLLPATRSSGKVWSKVSQYEATAAVLQAAGLDAGEGGSFRLRHTYAIRQLRRGRPPAELARWMGIVDLRVIDRYQRTVLRPADVT